MSLRRLRIFSDLHLEFFDWIPPAASADAVVLAGDIGIGTQGVDWARRHFPDTPVVFVPGNHEFYGACIPDARAELRDYAQRLGVYLLDGDACVIDGTRILGATLWTDYALYGSTPADLERAMAVAVVEMNDFRRINWVDGTRFEPSHARQMHLTQVAWLTEAIAEPFVGSTVVVTHHLPHRHSIHPKYEGVSLNPCFATDLDHLVRAPVALWAHGHTHESVDYVVNGTRVVCNPRGYLPREPNPAFDPMGVVELPQG